MILYQMVKHIWHVSSHVTKKPRIQSWTIYSSGCLCQHRCLTLSSKIFMGVPLLTAVGFVNHAWCTGHVSCCCKEVWSCLKEKALRLLSPEPFAFQDGLSFWYLPQKRTFSPPSTTWFARCPSKIACPNTNSQNFATLTTYLMFS